MQFGYTLLWRKIWNFDFKLCELWCWKKQIGVKIVNFYSFSIKQFCEENLIWIRNFCWTLTDRWCKRTKLPLNVISKTDYTVRTLPFLYQYGEKVEASKDPFNPPINQRILIVFTFVHQYDQFWCLELITHAPFSVFKDQLNKNISWNARRWFKYKSI